MLPSEDGLCLIPCTIKIRDGQEEAKVLCFSVYGFFFPVEYLLVLITVCNSSGLNTGCLSVLLEHLSRKNTDWKRKWEMRASVENLSFEEISRVF